MASVGIARSAAVVLGCAILALSACGSSNTRVSDRPAAALIDPTPGPTHGPLRMNPQNPRYFLDSCGKAIYLTGSHTWNSFQDWGATDPPPVFDYSKYLDFLVRHGHNFFRLYVWEQAAWVPWSGERVWFSPMPYQRTGPGIALDGKPRFDLRKWNDDYFRRLRDRVIEARDKGIYVAIMLFNGWSIDAKIGAMNEERRRRHRGNPWNGHPYNQANNSNGVNGDPDNSGVGSAVHTLRSPQIIELQKAYVHKVIDTVRDLDNVLWEISNESNADARAWEYEVIDFIKAVEGGRGVTHPVGMTAEYPGGDNADLFRSHADWVSPSSRTNGPYAVDPPAATEGKVVVTDTDHIWGTGGNKEWVWKSFTRGLCPILMDAYEADVSDFYPMYRGDPSAARKNLQSQDPAWELIRQQMGRASTLARRLDLRSLSPRPALSSTGYCLAGNSTYLVYVPAAQRRGDRWIRRIPANWFPEEVSVNLGGIPGMVHFQWLDPTDNVPLSQGAVEGGRMRKFPAPRRGGALLLFIYAAGGRPLES